MNDYYVIKTQEGQSVIDLAIENYGCFEGIYALLEDNAFLNGEITAVFPANYEIQVRKDLSFLAAEKRDWANFMRLRGKRINTHNYATLPEVNHEGETNAYLPDVMVIVFQYLSFNKTTIEVDAAYAGSFNTTHTSNISSYTVMLNGDDITNEPFTAFAGDVLEISIVKTNAELESAITFKQ